MSRDQVQPVPARRRAGQVPSRLRRGIPRLFAHALLVSGVIASAVILPAGAASIPSAPTPAGGIVHNPPSVTPPDYMPTSQIVVFPNRDFVTTEGYPAAAAPYTVNVLRNGVVIGGSTDNQVDSSGALQVNHPAAANAPATCWIGQTPNIRPGDLVRVTDRNGWANETTVRDLTIQAPVLEGDAVVVRGTARNTDGSAISLNQLDQRLIVKNVKFTNRKNRLRAPGDGVLTFDANDPTQTHWTAIYRNLSSTDISLALSAAPSISWLNDAVLTTESTSAEMPDINNGIFKGPQAPCAAPAQTGPTVQASVAAGSYRIPQTVQLTASDPRATINYTTDGTTPSSLPGQPGPVSVRVERTMTLQYLAVDAEANVSELGTQRYVIDTQAPVPNIDLTGASVVGATPTNTTYVSSVLAKLSATDAGESGLKTLSYVLDNHPATIVDNGATIAIGGDGNHTLALTAIDQAGNTSTVPATFGIDTLAPTVDVALSGAGNGSTYRTSVTVALTSNDATASLQYAIDGGQPVQVATNSTTLTVTAEGAHTVSAFAIDPAGNASGRVSKTFAIDSAAPGLTVSLNGTQAATSGLYRSAVDVAISSAGAGASLRYTVDGGQPVQVAGNSTTVNVASGGAHTILASAVDAAGNTSTPTTSTFTIDASAPTASIALSGPQASAAGTYQGYVLASLAGADDASGTGLDSIQYSLDGAPAVTVSNGAAVPVTGTGVHTLSVTATDKAGNTGTTSQTFIIEPEPFVAPVASQPTPPAAAPAPRSSGGSGGGGGGGSRGSSGGSSSAPVVTSSAAGGSFAAGGGASFGPAPVASSPAAAPAAVISAPATPTPVAGAEQSAQPTATSEATEAPAAGPRPMQTPEPAFVDGSLGGSVQTEDGSLQGQVAAGTSADVLSIWLATAAPGTENLHVNGHLYRLEILDSAHQPVLAFGQPIGLRYVLSADELAWLAGDPSAVPAVEVLNPETGAFEMLTPGLSADGLALEFGVVSAGLPASLAEAPQPEAMLEAPQPEAMLEAPTPDAMLEAPVSEDATQAAIAAEEPAAIVSEEVPPSDAMPAVEASEAVAEVGA
jgi:Chitobiase/beta-hexosaminidase C-terminal domain/Bacterial Ig-like domain